VVAGTGLLGIGAGAYFGLRALSGKNAADAQCVAGSCSPQGFTQSSDARSWAMASTIGMGAGLGLVLGGAAWWARDAQAGDGGGSRSAGQRAGPLALAATGLVSVGAGTYLGVHALDDTRARNAECVGRACTPAGVEDDAGARSSALSATVALGAGVVTIGGAAVWWILDSKRESGRPSAGGPVLGALGLVALGAAGYLGARVYLERSARDGVCSGGWCSPAAVAYDADARTSASLASIAFGAGLALIGTGTALWLTDPAHSKTRTTGLRASPRLGAGIASLSLEVDLP
jgi:hypothetical protein